MRTPTRLASLALLLAPALGALPHSTVGQTAQEIVARHVDAVGGEAVWRQVQTMRSTGSITMMGGMAEGPIVVRSKRPDMTRVEVTIQGVDVVQAFDGETGWTINPLMGSATPQLTDPLTLAAMREQADIDGPFVGWLEDGHTLGFGTPTTLDRVETIAIDLLFANGEVTTFHLHPDTYLVMQIVATREGIGATTATLSDYREVSGVMLPFSAVSVSGQGDQTVVWDSIEINIDTPDSIFAMPDGS